MEFINWGQETQQQLEARLRAEHEWAVLIEQAVNIRRQQTKTVSAAGGSSKEDSTTNHYVEDGYIDNYFQ